MQDSRDARLIFKATTSVARSALLVEENISRFIGSIAPDLDA